MEAGPDIVNFDAYSYMDYFLIYPEHIADFILKGGKIAWGIVPTFVFKGNETIKELKSNLIDGIQMLKRHGIKSEIILSHSLITPACGMGTMKEEHAEKALYLLAELSSEMSNSLEI